MSNFLDDQIVELFDNVIVDEIPVDDFHGCFADLLLKKMPKNFMGLTDVKRIQNGVNLAIDRIQKKYGWCPLKKDQFFEAVKNGL